MTSLDPFDPDSLSPDNLSAELRQRQSQRGTIVLWLVAASFLILLVPLYLVSAAVRGDAARLETNIQAAQQALTTVNTPEPEIQELMDEITQVQGSISEIEQAYSGVAASHLNWPAVMAAIGNYDPSQLILDSVTQADNRVTLQGRAIGDSAVIAYSRALEETDLFARVVVQSMSLIATPFATPVTRTVEPSSTPLTPTATVSPTASPTPTPDPADQYEVDDFTPQPVFLGRSQLHSFYPIYDVDRVKFLAKAGRYYRVSTADLSPGVDTFLTVILGGTTYTNDDREPGDLSSEIIFQAGAGSDVEAIVKVTNRGQYGPDSLYQVTVEEVVPTPTPMPTPTPTPTSTPTPTPTSLPSSTATPADTPTPTPDLRDEYEPDDTSPKPIAIGETQKHNFYPDNDADQVEFLAKAGRYYRVFTSDLVPGVDTFLTVRVGETTYTNDDRDDDREPGDLSSEVVFQAEARYDVSTIVEVTNRRQYGSDKWYSITVEEVVPTPTPLPTETPLPSSGSSSSKLPGVASLGCFLSAASSFASAGPPQMIAGRAGVLTDVFYPLHPSPHGDERALGVLNSEAVEFVIVLELKTESP
jgi:Tfp pilus assembly protein PilN